MKTTLHLPDDLVREIKLRAVREGKKLKDEVADLLRKGLAAGASEARILDGSEESLSQRRREIAEKFISGEWGVELSGYEAGRAAERDSARVHADLWRK
jgi:plasmid stability protein